MHQGVGKGQSFFKNILLGLCVPQPIKFCAPPIRFCKMANQAKHLLKKTLLKIPKMEYNKVAKKIFKKLALNT